MTNENANKIKDKAVNLGKKVWERVSYRPFWNEYGYMAFCMLIPAILIYLIYAARGQYPIGDGSVLVLDLNGQYVWFFEALRNFVRGDAELLYSFSRQLGGEFLGIYAYYLASPLSFLVALFPKARMLEALTALFMVKGGLCGLTFGLYMHKSTKHPNKIAIIISSISYALCSYAIIQQHNTMWIDAVMWLPLITLGIESIIKHGKFKLYVVSLAIAVFSNYYIGYMLCIYCVIYFFIYYFANTEKFGNNPLREKAHFLRSLGRIVGYSALALGIAAVIILGAYYSLNFGKTTFSDPSWDLAIKFNWFDFLYKLLPGSYDTVRPEGLPFVYCGVLTLLLIPVYFASKKYSAQQKFFSALLLIILFFCFSVNIIDLIWHGFQKPNWLNYRYSFMFSFYLCVLACRAFGDLERTSYPILLGTGGFIGVFCLLLKLYENGDYIKPKEIECLLFTAIAVALYLIIIFIRRIKALKFISGIILACVVTVELFISGLLGMNGLVMDVGCSTYSRYNDFLKGVRPIVETVQKQDDSFYRMEKTFYRSNNDNMALMMRGLSGSTSTLNKETIRFLNSLGYASKAHWTKYLGNTPVTDSLLGIKYLISQDSLYENYYEIFATDEANGYTAYYNPYALSIAYGVSDDLLDFELGFVEETEDKKEDATKKEEEKESGEGIKNAISSLKGLVNEWLDIEENKATVYVDDYRSPFDRLNAILAAMLGEEEPVAVFVPVSSKVASTDGVTTGGYTGSAGESGASYKLKDSKNTNGSITIVTNALPQTAEIFFYAPSGYPREVGLELSVNDDKGVNKGTFMGNDTSRIISLGEYQQDSTLSLKLTLKKSDLYLDKNVDYFWYVDMDAYKNVMERLGQNQFQIEEYTEHSFEGTYTASRANELVLTTIAYDNGWEVWVDGKQVEVTKALGALISFHVGGEAGETHDVRIVYSPKTINIGLIVSILCILLFIILIVLDRRFHFGCKKRTDVDYNDGRGMDDTDENSDGDIKDPTDEFQSILNTLKVVFIPPKKEKYVHQHSKKRKKK